METYSRAKSSINIVAYIDEYKGQNLPSTGSKFAKSVKQLFSAPDGWLFAGADFDSLTY